MPEPKIDRRVRRTREAIYRALLSLMLEKGYEAVTVSDIIDRADVGRSTFYAHFTDKQQVLYDSLDDLASVLRTYRNTHSPRLFGFSRPMFEHVHEQRHLLRSLLGRRGGAVVQARFAHVLTELVREELTALTGSRPTAAPTELVVTGIVGAYMALMWRMDENESHTPEQLDTAFRRLITPGIIAALNLPIDQLANRRSEEEIP